jgi:hypothetical protein
MKPLATMPPSVPEQGPGAVPGSVQCKSCKAVNPADFKFCGSCGSQLAPITATRLPVPADAQAAKAVPLVELVLIRPDGSDGGSHATCEKKTVIGRGSGRLFDGDTYLSPAHMILEVIDENRLRIDDAGSVNGVFVRISQEEPLQTGGVFRIGQELLRFDTIRSAEAGPDGTEIMGSPNPGYWGRLSLIVGMDLDGSAFPLMGREMVLGRERGDILFSDDGYVSGTHAKLTYRDEDVILTDLNSSNGTFVKLRGPRMVPFGTHVLIGQQLFRIDRPQQT